jgi:proteasome lid subunit RPN8/RPN11
MTPRRWQIPVSVVTSTELALRSGAHEVFVLWTAPLSTALMPIVPIERAIVPAQCASATRAGVYVHIEGSELARIQFENFNRGERNVVQLHTHPGANVDMSELDREWEVVRHVGALSIIVPHYGRGPLQGFAGVHVYERETSDWRLLSAGEAAKRLIIQ